MRLASVQESSHILPPSIHTKLLGQHRHKYAQYVLRRTPCDIYQRGTIPGDRRPRALTCRHPPDVLDTPSETTQRMAIATSSDGQQLKVVNTRHRTTHAPAVMVETGSPRLTSTHIDCPSEAEGSTSEEWNKDLDKICLKLKHTCKNETPQRSSIKFISIQ